MTPLIILRRERLGFTVGISLCRCFYVPHAGETRRNTLNSGIEHEIRQGILDIRRNTFNPYRNCEPRKNQRSPITIHQHKNQKDLFLKVSPRYEDERQIVECVTLSGMDAASEPPWVRPSGLQAPACSENRTTPIYDRWLGPGLRRVTHSAICLSDPQAVGPLTGCVCTKIVAGFAQMISI